ncbi:helix-turn-helix domain-containing protein [Streptomyces sp. NPDC015492]|uniref:XRE family transcriptional regulator n=1 Tax=Streptomyces sp. NPDC015492 TaxID=3364958 RepID=UPI0036FEECC5
MPGWKALPEELDPDVRAFTERLRRLIERSGLGVTAVAERTGRERSAWDAYLNARRPAPRSAVVALAEVTGSDPAGLATDWERAERAWARIAPGAGGGDGRAAGPVDGDGGHRDGPAPDQTLQIRRIDRPDRAAAAPGGMGVGGPGVAGATGVARASGVPGPAGEARGPGGPGSTAEPPAPGAPGPTSEPRAPGSVGEARPPGAHGEPRTPGAHGASRTPARPPHGDPAFTAPRPSAAVPPSHLPGPTTGATPARTPDSRRRKVLLYATGIVGALLVVTAALLLVDLGGSEGPGGDDRAAAPTTTTAPPTTRPADLPPGVRCAGSDCTGRDPEEMGCGGPLATTVARAVVGGAQVEVRHSETCGASWARLSGGAPRDTVTIRVGDAERSATVAEGADTVATGTDAYTPMVAVPPGAAAQACGLLADGGEGCTTGP